MNIISRPLTNIEKGMEILNLYGGASNIVLVSQITGNLSTSVLRQGLDRLQAQTPFLQCRIKKADQNWSFTTEATAKIPLTVLPQTDFEIADIVNKELNEAIASSECLLRVIAICHQGSENISSLITTAHHGITDGISCVALHEKLFKVCQSIQHSDVAREEPHSLFAPEDLVAVEDFMPAKLFTVGGEIQKYIRILNEIRKGVFNKHQTLASEQQAQLKDYRCGFLKRKLAPELSVKIINQCRQHQVTVQGAIAAAMLISVTNQIRTPEQPIIKAVCRNGVDVRRLFDADVKPEKLGVFAAPIATSHQISDRPSFWDLARDVVQQINTGIANQDAFFNLRILDQLLGYLANHPDQLDASTADISNIGKLDIEETYGEFELTEISFVTSNRVFANSILVAVSTFRRQVILNFVSSEPSVSQQTREAIASNVVDYLTNM